MTQHTLRGLYEIFARFQEFSSGVAPSRRENIHLASVVGGLYGLNLIPMFLPKEITFFDINPNAIAFFNLIRRVWIASATVDGFLGKLKSGNYDVHTEQDRLIRNCIAARQNGTLTEDRGQSARSLLSSWRYALDHFELTRQILAERPCNTRVEGMQSNSFGDFVANRRELVDLLLQRYVIFVLRPYLSSPPKCGSVCLLLRPDRDAGPG